MDYRTEPAASSSSSSQGLKPVLRQGLNLRAGAFVNRRLFLALLGAGLAVRPCPVLAQGRKTFTIGILVAQNPDPTRLVAAIREGLKGLGYVEGANLVVELRTGNANVTELAPLAADLVARKVDLLFAYPTPAATVAKQAAKDIPIVILSADPVGTGLVEKPRRAPAATSPAFPPPSANWAPRISNCCARCCRPRIRPLCSPT